MGRITITNIDSVISKLSAVEMDNLRGKILDRAGSTVEGIAKQEGPIDTGNLMRSVTKTRGLNTMTVKPDSKVAQYVHHGTGKYAGGADGGKQRWNRTTALMGKLGKSRSDMIKMFAGMRKRGVQMSMRPDKFMDRSKEKAEPKVVQDAQKIIQQAIK